MKVDTTLTTFHGKSMQWKRVICDKSFRANSRAVETDQESSSQRKMFRTANHGTGRLRSFSLDRLCPLMVQAGNWVHVMQCINKGFS
jgi:hypothetical protein